MNTPGSVTCFSLNARCEPLMGLPGWNGPSRLTVAPACLRSDHGPEFIAKEMPRWLAEHKVKTLYIDPGSPWQNGFVESFHARFRDECLNQEPLWTLTEARVVVADFR